MANSSNTPLNNIVPTEDRPIKIDLNDQNIEVYYGDILHLNQKYAKEGENKSKLLPRLGGGEFHCIPEEWSLVSPRFILNICFIGDKERWVTPMLMCLKADSIFDKILQHYVKVFIEHVYKGGIEYMTGSLEMPPGFTIYIFTILFNCINGLYKYNHCII